MTVPAHAEEIAFGNSTVGCRDEVHLHTVRLGGASLPPPEALALLPQADQQQLVQLRGTQQARFARSRIALRCVLARYLHRQPELIEIDVSDRGKPYLAAEDLRFNLSHSGDLLAVAVTYDLDLGVDMEQVRPMPNAISIARRFFHADEVRCIDKPGHAQTERFFRCWTQKEAVLKATGEGLLGDMDSFCVSASPAGGLVSMRTDDAQLWTVASWTPAPGYSGAVAYRDPSRRSRMQVPLHGTSSAALILRLKPHLYR